MVMPPGSASGAGSRKRCTYLPMMSFSRLTGSPGFFSSRMVCAPVCGMMDTEKPAPSTAATVRLDRHRRGQADAVDGDRAFGDNAAQDCGGRCDGDPDRIAFAPFFADLPHAIDVPGHDMSAKAAVRRHGAFQIHAGAAFQQPERRAAHGFRHHIRGEAIAGKAGHGQAHAVDRNAVPEPGAFQHCPGGNFNCAVCRAGRNPAHGANLFYNSGKHFSPPAHKPAADLARRAAHWPDGAGRLPPAPQPPRPRPGFWRPVRRTAWVQ